MGIKDPKDKAIHKQKDMNPEITAFRVLLRQRGYLQNPCQSRGMVSLSGKELDTDLVNFSSLSREKRAKYYEVYRGLEFKRTIVRTTVPFGEHPVFIDAEERQQYTSITAKTIKELMELVENSLKMITDSNIRCAFEDGDELKCMIIMNINGEGNKMQLFM